jgi:hypothetical protein
MNIGSDSTTPVTSSTTIASVPAIAASADGMDAHSSRLRAKAHAPNAASDSQTALANLNSTMLSGNDGDTRQRSERKNG